MSLRDISQELHVGEVDNDELLALMSSAFGIQHHNPKSPHKVEYGSGDLIATFKSGTSTVLKVEIETATSAVGLSSLKSKIERFLLQGEGNDVVGSTVIFSSKEHIWRFRWNDQFQIGPMPPNSPMPKNLIGDWPALIQYCYKSTEDLLLDGLRDSKARDKWSLLCSVFIPIVSTTLLKADTSRTAKHVWTIQMSSASKLTTQFAQEGYHYPRNDLKVDSFYEGGHSCEYSDDLGTLPRLFGSFEALTSTKQDEFLRACHWYRRAVLSRSYTDTLLNCAIMVESLLPNEAETCDCCGQNKYTIARRFTEFFVEYGHTVPDTEGLDEAQTKLVEDAASQKKESIERFAKDVYGLRSGIAHQAMTLGQGHGVFLSTIIPVHFRETHTASEMLRISNTMLGNWILNASRSSC